MFPTHLRYSALANAFNVSVLIARCHAHCGGLAGGGTNSLYMPLIALDELFAVVGLITGLTMKEPPTSPCAVRPRRLPWKKRVTLQEHHDNIEQKIEDIDAEIAALQTKRENRNFVTPARIN